MREHLLKKLENDAKLLKSKNKQDTLTSNSTSPSTANDNNKVYKYFSNSARREFNRSTDRLICDGDDEDINANNDFELNLSHRSSALERECFHIAEKICPLCDDPLRTYESFCIKCEQRLSLHGKSNEHSPGCQEAVCEKCHRLYALCSSCETQNDVCRACRRKRKICMKCRRSLCSFCLEEVATGRDAESGQNHKLTASNCQSGIKHDEDSPGSERSFQIIDVDYIQNSKQKDGDLQNKPDSDVIRPPYSMHIDRNSIFHPKYSTNEKLQAKPLFGAVDDKIDFDRVRCETDKRLSRYMKNYGDLAMKDKACSKLHNRSTQTIPDGTGRRDIVMVEENNLSMPLLREMPKMTRKETTSLAEKAANNRRIMENLSRRWEVRIFEIKMNCKYLFNFFRFQQFKSTQFLKLRQKFSLNWGLFENNCSQKN